jgi:hypothetical protein
VPGGHGGSGMTWHEQVAGEGLLRVFLGEVE